MNIPETRPSIPPRLPEPTPQLTDDVTSEPQMGFQIEPHPDGDPNHFILKNVTAQPMTTVDELNQAVNNFRHTHNLNQLVIPEDLCEIANKRAIEASTDFSHRQFEESVQKGEYNYVSFELIGENLWQGSLSGVHIVEFGWDKSPGHRQNLLRNWDRGCAGVFETTAVFVFAR